MNDTVIASEKVQTVSNYVTNFQTGGIEVSNLQIPTYLPISLDITISSSDHFRINNWLCR